MNHLHKPLLFILLWLLSATGNSAVQASGTASVDSVAVFRFLPGDDLFVVKGNQAQLDKLYGWIDRLRTAITQGSLHIYVDGYSASLPTAKANLSMAHIRSNRVKSELIIRKRLQEAHFITANHAQAYHNQKDMVVVTLHFPVRGGDMAVSDASAIHPDTTVIPTDTAVILSDTAVILSEAKNLRPQSAEHEILRSAQNDKGISAVPSATNDKAEQSPNRPPYCFALRTNLLYDALLLPTLGVEWRPDSRWGVRLDGSLSRWGGNGGKVQKLWLLNPEVRRYLLRDKCLYAGLSANFGHYNIYRYPLGNLLADDNTGYQGKLWGMGIAVGYQLRLLQHLWVDFNLGLGYTRSEYDSFTSTDKVRIYKERNKRKNLWGPTQAGICLVWSW